MTDQSRAEEEARKILDKCMEGCPDRWPVWEPIAQTLLASDLKIKKLEKALTGRTVSCEACNGMAEKIKELDDALRIAKEALKDVVTWFDYISEYQYENLIHNQTLESASENWERMVDCSYDFNKLKQALKALEDKLK